jgi:hypothetical protein
MLGKPFLAQLTPSPVTGTLRLDVNNLLYYTTKAIKLSDIRKVAERNSYKCTSYKLLLESGAELIRLNIHFKYEDEGEQLEAFWQWLGGTHYGYESLEPVLEKFEAWRRDRYKQHRPASGFVINYHLFSLPYLVQCIIPILKSYQGWIEDAFSDEMYTLDNIEHLPTATAAYINMLNQNSEPDD